MHEYRLTCHVAISLMSQYSAQISQIHKLRAEYRASVSELPLASSSGAPSGTQTQIVDGGVDSTQALGLVNLSSVPDQQLANTLEGELIGFRGEDSDEEEDGLGWNQASEGQGKELLDGTETEWDEALKVIFIFLSHFSSVLTFLSLSVHLL